MSALSDFVNDYRSKVSGTRTFSVSQIGSNVSSAFKGYLRTDANIDDTEALTDTPTTSGTLPAGRNRRTNFTWFGFASSDENFCGLSRLQRIVAFFMCLIGAAFCFGTAILVLPMLVLNARKFASLNTLGSTFFIMSFGFLWGPIAYVQFFCFLRKEDTSPLLICSVLLLHSTQLQNTLLTVVCATFQAIALVFYVMSYIPGGERGLRFMTSLCTGQVRKQAQTVLPI
ncbi:Vesicle transport protein [Aphelenchoides besseyi]|nr:Vesicle transport protein [Aphelenchoides besseyi]